MGVGWTLHDDDDNGDDDARAENEDEAGKPKRNIVEKNGVGGSGYPWSLLCARREEEK